MSNTGKRLFYSFTTILIWATAFVFTRVVDMPTGTIGALRCLTASIFLVIFGSITKSHTKKSARDTLKMMIAGAFGFGFYLIFFNMGMKMVTASTGSIIVALTPVFTAFGASFIYKEKLSRVGYVCIMTAFCGVLILMLWNGALEINRGVIWLLICVGCFVIYNLMTRGLQKAGYGAVEIVTWAMIAGFIVQIPVAPHMFADFASADLRSQLLLIYMGIFCSGVSYTTWNKAFSYAEKTTQVSNFMFLTPFVSTIMGLLLLGETPDIATLVGGTVIIASVITFGLKGTK